MNTTQVPTRSVNGLVATGSSVAPLSSLHQGNKENASPLPPPVYSRVITKESLQDNFEADPIISSSLTSSSNDDEHYFHSSLCDFDFSILEPDNKESEFLSLPLTAIELPLTPPLIEPIVSGSFDSATLLTPPAAVSVSTESSSYLLSTAAAIAASQQHAVASSIRAPPIVSVAAPPLAVVSPKPTKRKARAYSTISCNSAKVTTQPQQPPGAAASTSLFNSLITQRLTQRLMSSNISMDHQPPQQAAVPTPATIAAPPPALAPRPCPVPSATFHRAGGQPLPPKKYAPSPTPVGTMSQGVSAYHHTHPPPPAHPARARVVSNAAPPASPGTTAPPNTVSAIHPTTGQVENTGRWTAEEHRLFLQGLEQHGKGWKKIATLIQSRTVVQIRTHAQKYFQKLAKARQNGENVVGPGMGTVGGGVMASVPPGHNVQFDAAEAREIGIAIPVGPDGQPVVTMRTTTHPNSSGNHHGNMSLGNDPSSMAAAGGQVGIATAAGMAAAGGAMGGGRKRRNAAPGGGTKRRAIGNVVRSAVREGRNVKRQKIAEGKRKVVLPRGVTPAAHAVPSAQAFPVQVLSMAQPPANGAKEEYQVPNPLPAVSNVLESYVATTTMGVRPPPLVAGTAAAAAAKKNGRGRQQIVQTALHGRLPMAALEDAVFRLLTPATGAPSPLMQPQPHPNCANINAIVDPLAPSNRIPIAHTQYYPTATAPGTAYHQGIPTGMSPTGVADMSLLPSWVDSKNPPSWYNDGSDIDTLLEDADCLNWLSDTGDLVETYAPAMVEPATVVSSSNSSGAHTAAPFILEPMPMTVQDPTGSVVHTSEESLSFLVDPPEQQGMMLMAPMPVAAVLPQPGAAVTAHKDHMEDVNRLPSFLDEDARPPPPPPTITDQLAPEPTATTAETLPYSSATEAVESIVPEHKLAGVGESDTNLMGFPDLDMGDEQAFVSALLENSGQGTMSFPKLHSDLHMSQINMSSGNNQSGVALNCRVGSGVLAGEEHVLDQN
eukprot:CAMPEP_0201884900 /NCGR_PEP_ID=MMETSP0902-20130614/17612_1 /ASSEMBLY_ACC=CAM_ASM_000551 /TAXON_ID=420261 /ORGANISM="Thalassiosira antarctica, Strain CCMP982" /LENGTH=1000 /DNA_ID=CAMNT_0048413915 /DNA_START=188 /DNA_END=3190 /DNA_ORIENTATION=-